MTGHVTCQTCVNVIMFYIVVKFEGVLMNHWKVMGVLNFLQIRLWPMVTLQTASEGIALYFS